MLIPSSKRYKLSPDFLSQYNNKVAPFGYGVLSSIVFYDHYSRLKDLTDNNTNNKVKDNISCEPTKENWQDCVKRCTEGTFSILNMYKTDNVTINFDSKSKKFFDYMFNLKFCPPGRGLWIMGTKYMYERGSMSLNNCGFVSIENLADDVCWAFDCLMCCVGIGFDTNWNQKLYKPTNYDLFKSCPVFGTVENYIIPDTREGWVESLRLLLSSFTEENKTLPVFYYGNIRTAGKILNGIGGTSSGPEPLILLHKRILGYLSLYYYLQENIGDVKTGYKNLIEYLNSLENYYNLEEMENIINTKDKTYGKSRLIVDIMNAVGCCVQSGNVRRSAELALSNGDDDEFYDLKDRSINPERDSISYMSNNTVRITNENISTIDKVCKKLMESNRGEPGIFNMVNAQNYGRIRNNLLGREGEKDECTGINPCAEIVLKSREFCNLSEVFVNKHLEKNNNGKTILNTTSFTKACKYALLYSFAVSLLPTHDEKSNKIVNQNHRLGVSISGNVLLQSIYNLEEIAELYDFNYTIIRKYAAKLANMYGVCEPIRITTIKPSGTISLLAGCPPGVHYSICNRYVIRRKRINKLQPICKFLIKAGYHYEQDLYSPSNWVFDFPLDQGDCKSEKDVSITELLDLVKVAQANWADNSVSVTATYTKDELTTLDKTINTYLPYVKTLSFLPKSDIEYKQAVYEAITKEQYDEMISTVKPINWAKFENNDKEDSELIGFCDGDFCVNY